MTSPIGAGAPAGVTSATSTPRGGTAGLGSDDFLKLLVAQLKYQDPSNPADSSAFLTQTAQLTQVDALAGIAAQQAQMLTATLSSQAGGLVGRTVDYLDADGTRLTGQVRSATFGATPTLRIDDLDVPLSRVVGERSAP
jgi:flagellar basal-body rod modification protein FlgD